MIIYVVMSVNLTTVGLVQIKVLWNKSYNFLISVHDVTSKILSCNSNYFVDVVLWPKFGNPNISMRAFIIMSILQNVDKKCQLFERCSWFKLNNLGLALDMAWKFYTSVTKELKLKVENFWVLIPTFVEVTGRKPVLLITTSRIGLKCNKHKFYVGLF